MTYGHNVAAYRETQVMRSKEQIVPLLYHHLLVNLRKAAAQIQAKDYEGKAESLTKASEILFELMGSLDFEAGGELSVQLQSLYMFWLEQIRVVGRSLDTTLLERIIEMVGELHESWVQAAAAVEATGGVRGDVA